MRLTRVYTVEEARKEYDELQVEVEGMDDEMAKIYDKMDALEDIFMADVWAEEGL